FTQKELQGHLTSKHEVFADVDLAHAAAAQHAQDAIMRNCLADHGARSLYDRAHEEPMTMTSPSIGLAFAVSAALVAAAAASAAQRPSGGAAVTSLYDLKTTTLLGKPTDLGIYRGKVTLVVNVASYCGFTPQYKGLEKLSRDLADKPFAVLGF